MIWFCANFTPWRRSITVSGTEAEISWPALELRLIVDSVLGEKSNAAQAKPPRGYSQASAGYVSALFILCRRIRSEKYRHILRPAPRRWVANSFALSTGGSRPAAQMAALVRMAMPNCAPAFWSACSLLLSLTREYRCQTPASKFG